MTILEDISPGHRDEVNVVIENPKGTQNKYEYNHDKDLFELDRVLHTLFVYPTDYGFIPESLAEDGDALDAFVFMREPTSQGVVIKARPVGIVYMIDDGEQDNKLLCVPVDDPKYDEVKDISDLRDHVVEEIKHFLEHYKDLEGKEVKIEDFGGIEEAKKEFDKAVNNYEKTKK